MRNRFNEEREEEGDKDKGEQENDDEEEKEEKEDDVAGVTEDLLVVSWGEGEI